MSPEVLYHDSQPETPQPTVILISQDHLVNQRFLPLIGCSSDGLMGFRFSFFFASCLPVCFFPCAFLAEVWCRGLGNQRSRGFSFGLALGIVLLCSEVVKTAELLTDSLSFPVQCAVQHCDMEEMEQQGICRFDNLAPRLMHTGFHDCLNQQAKTLRTLLF